MFACSRYPNISLYRDRVIKANTIIRVVVTVSEVVRHIRDVGHYSSKKNEFIEYKIIIHFKKLRIYGNAKYE